MSTAWRILLIVIAVLGLGLGLLTRQEMEATKRHYREAVEEPLVDFAHVLAALVPYDPSAKTLSFEGLNVAMSELKAKRFSAIIYELEKSTVDLQVYATDQNGIVRFDSVDPNNIGKDYSKWNDVYETLRGRYGARSTQRDGVTVLHVAAPIERSGKIVGTLTVAKPTDNSSQFILAARRSTHLLAFAIFFAVALLGLILSRIVTKPIRALTGYVQALSAGKRVSLPALSGPDFKMLGKSFEEMREALEGKKYVERYVQTLTHEIKSPLAGIQAAAELLTEDLSSIERDKLLENITTESVRIKTLVDKLLTLSALQALPQSKNQSSVLISDVIESVVSSTAPLSLRKKLNITVSGELSSTVTGDSFWIDEAVRNLISNAIEFSPVGGRVDVVVKQNKNFVEIEIKNSGPQIPDWALPKVFDQFFSLPRPDSNRKSSGIGLSIVKEVAERQGGEITIENFNEASCSGVRAILRLRLT